MLFPYDFEAALQYILFVHCDTPLVSVKCKTKSHPNCSSQKTTTLTCRVRFNEFYGKSLCLFSLFSLLLFKLYNFKKFLTVLLILEHS